MRNLIYLENSGPFIHSILINIQSSQKLFFQKLSDTLNAYLLQIFQEQFRLSQYLEAINKVYFIQSGHSQDFIFKIFQNMENFDVIKNIQQIQLSFKEAMLMIKRAWKGGEE